MVGIKIELFNSINAYVYISHEIDLFSGRHNCIIDSNAVKSTSNDTDWHRVFLDAPSNFLYPIDVSYRVLSDAVLMNFCTNLLFVIDYYNLRSDDERDFCR